MTCWAISQFFSLRKIIPIQMGLCQLLYFSMTYVSILHFSVCVYLVWIYFDGKNWVERKRNIISARETWNRCILKHRVSLVLGILNWAENVSWWNIFFYWFFVCSSMIVFIEIPLVIYISPCVLTFFTIEHDPSKWLSGELKENELFNSISYESIIITVL